LSNLQIESILNSIAEVKQIYEDVVAILPSFAITNKDVLPYGLKPHTRSISWIVEQVIVQQTKYNKDKLKLKNVDFNMPATCLHDIIIEKNNKKYYINVKIHNIDGKENKNDMSAVEKLYFQYQTNFDYNFCLYVWELNFKI
jgi:hypothetical protein